MDSDPAVLLNIMKQKAREKEKKKKKLNFFGQHKRHHSVALQEEEEAKWLKEHHRVLKPQDWPDYKRPWRHICVTCQAVCHRGHDTRLWFRSKVI